ncbi:MAG: hypothetical protein JWM80_2343 [Cyanobacteria bacterium RYN_339]|nr:hypothetical protein [Cyanobacteria bacterium RYN_339]
MKSKAEYRGHPIHPMLIGVPIGLWLASLVADVAYMFTYEAFYFSAAQWTMGFGVLGALAAAIPGLMDYFGPVQRSAEARRTAFAHGGINLAVTMIYAVNWFFHANGANYGAPLALAVALNVLGFGMVAVSGWLGGELVYRLGLGFDTRRVSITMLEDEEARVPTETR